MKPTTVFLSGIILIALITMSIFVTGMVFDTGKKIDVETYFFQPGDSQIQRPGKPISPESIGASEMRDLIIKKYVTDYFYVLPDRQDTQNRLDGKTSLRTLSRGAVFAKWQQDTGAKIMEMTEENMLRTVNVLSISQEMTDSSYWRVDFELKTWTTPNDLNTVPETTKHFIYMNIAYEPGFREREYMPNNISVEQYLEAGNDPVAVFKFRVDDIVFPE